MTTHTEKAAGQEKTERSASGPAVIDSGEPSRGLCPICGTPLRGRQTSACSDRCRSAKSRRKRSEALTERDQRVRGLLEAAMRVLAGGG